MPKTTARTPNWGPAEAFIPDLLPVLMWMGTVEHDGQKIEQYKHYDLRTYINLDPTGQAWIIAFSEGGVLVTAARIDIASARLAVGG